MCPLTKSLQLIILIFTLILIFRTVAVKSFLNINFNPSNLTLYMYDTVNIQYNASGDDSESCILYSENPDVVSIAKDVMIKSPQNGSFNITGNFLGETIIACKFPQLKNSNQSVIASDHVKIKCLRKQGTIDKVFTISIAILVAIIYINFGCAIQWGEVKDLLRRPIGPSIGVFGHFFLMPIFSYFIGYFLFPNSPAMRLGMFFTGVSPAGGASNIWTAVLDGNIELSVVMTTISTIGAFAFMPLWIFTLGKTIFKDAHLQVPYTQISSFVFALVFPLLIGYLINRHLKRLGAFLTRILKGFSSLLIIFIIIFASVTNLYIFKLFSWKIIIASIALPWLGYIAGYSLARIFKQPPRNALAIGIEVGIQNTGIAFYLLRFTLDELQADLTLVVPVGVALMTPIPLTILYCYKKISQRCGTNKNSNSDISEWSPKTASIKGDRNDTEYYVQQDNEPNLKI